MVGGVVLVVEKEGGVGRVGGGRGIIWKIKAGAKARPPRHTAHTWPSFRKRRPGPPARRPPLSPPVDGEDKPLC